MAKKVTGELYESVTGQLFEIGRQLRQPNGYPFDPQQLKRALQEVIEGRFSPEESKHVIDCDADPFIPDGWKVEEHRKGGKLVWDASAVTLFLSDGQKNHEVIEGKLLRKELASKPVLNANVLDYLLKNSALIPEEWKDKYVFFWGTIYHLHNNSPHVRFLYWFDGRWSWSCYELDEGWIRYYSAALRAT